jgi:hypothetical protein
MQHHRTVCNGGIYLSNLLVEDAGCGSNCTGSVLVSSDILDRLCWLFGKFIMKLARKARLSITSSQMENCAKECMDHRSTTEMFIQTSLLNIDDDLC